MFGHRSRRDEWNSFRSPAAPLRWLVPPKVPCFSHPTQGIALHPKYVTKLVCSITQRLDSNFSLEAFLEWWATLGENESSRGVLFINSSQPYRAVLLATPARLPCIQDPTEKDPLAREAEFCARWKLPENKTLVLSLSRRSLTSMPSVSDLML